MPAMISIDNLYPDTDVRDLIRVFGNYGRITSAKTEHVDFLVKGRICYSASSSADIAFEELNGKTHLGNPMQIKVIKCEEQENGTDIPQIDPSKVFVRNLDPSWDELDVMKIFEKFGDVDEAKVSKTDGKSRGIGFVKFSEPTSAKRAIEEMKKKSKNQSSLLVKPYIPFEVREEIRQSAELDKNRFAKRSNLYVKNLAANVTDDELKDLFQPFGTILSVKVLVDKSGKSKGFGFVCFEKEEDAEEACEKMDNCEYKSEYLQVRFHKNKSERKTHYQAMKAYSGLYGSVVPQTRDFSAVAIGRS